MKRTVVIVFVCCCIMSWGTPGLAVDEGPEREVSLADIPAAARAAIEDFADGGEIDEVKMEEEDGRIVYEAEIEKADGESVIEVTADGLLLKEVAPGWTPEEIQALTEPKLIVALDVKEIEL